MKKLIIISSLLLISLFGLGQKYKTDTLSIITIPKQILTQSLNTCSKLDSFIDEWINKPYCYGGTSTKGIDCSAFTQKFYQYIFNIDIPRTAYKQYKQSTKITKEEMVIGDLLFFISPLSPSGWHVCVYIGSGKILHAANKKRGVVIDELSKSMLNKIYSVGRIFNNI